MSYTLRLTEDAVKDIQQHKKLGEKNYSKRLEYY